MYITERIQSEDLASYELVKQPDAEVEDNLGIHSGRYENMINGTKISFVLCLRYIPESIMKKNYI
jgi:hypothetical protein